MGNKSERFRGVRKRQWGSWVSEIRHPITKIRVWLGSFQSAEEAALAYDEAARFISGPNAKTNFPYGINCNSKKLQHDRLSPALREKLRRSCYFELSPTKKLTHDVQNLSSYSIPSKLNVTTHNFNSSTAKQSFCRDMIANSRYAIFSSWNDLCETDTSTSEELVEPQVVASHKEANEIKTNEMKNFLGEQLAASNDINTTNDDYFVAEMIDELLNYSSCFDLEFGVLDFH